jgi:phosphohistidine phosphatase SixA
MKSLPLLLAAAASALLLLPTRAAPNPEAVEPVTVILLRHAETEEAGVGSRDPELSADGQDRAAALARLLSATSVTQLYASEFQRTQLTLAPLATQLALEVEVVSARTPQDQLAMLRALPPGSTAVICGHSNTVPGMVTELGGTARDLTDHPTYGPMLPHEAYDRLFVLTLPVGPDIATATVELRYGD